MEVAIIGGGSFGTAMANIAAGNGFVAHLWVLFDGAGMGSVTTGGKPVDVAFALPAGSEPASAVGAAGPTAP